VQPALEVAEEDRDGFDALRIGEILETIFLDLVSGDALRSLLLRLQVEFFELPVGERQKITQVCRHSSVLPLLDTP
jgi:hypothetical protein